MNKKWLPYLLIALLAVALVLLRTFKKIERSPATTNGGHQAGKDPSGINRDHGFDRRISYLEYSNHADCRMGCRHISQAEVEEIMKDGKINYNKSEIRNSRCPRYAVEGITGDKQRVRVVFAQCNEKTEVVTVIDLDTDWPCDCPGDDAKYKNKY